MATRPTGPEFPIVLIMLSLGAVFVVTYKLIFGEHGTAKDIDWIVPLSMIVYGQATRWFERPAD